MMESINDILTKSPVVIDNGSGQIKAGLGGEDKPKLIFNSFVGRPKYKALPIANQQDFYVGNNIKDDYRGLLKLKYPLQRGAVTNWTDMDLIWRYTYSELKASLQDVYILLKYPNYQKHPVLLTEPIFTPHSQQWQACQLFFETYSVPALFFAIQGVLSLFASGKTTGIVLDSGDGVSHTVPVYDGFFIQHASNRVDLAGCDVTQNMRNLLRRNGYNFTTSAELEIVKKIKEKRSIVSLTPIQEDKFGEEKGFKDSYMLPDNSVIELSFEKQRAPEILFNPDNYGLECQSIPEIVANSLARVDLDLRRTLYQEIVITGGTSMIQGFPERLLGDVKKLLPKDAKVKLWSPPERTTLCWQGGSILSHLTSFKNMWIMKDEYKEYGQNILYRKKL